MKVVLGPGQFPDHGPFTPVHSRSACCQAPRNGEEWMVDNAVRGIHPTQQHAAAFSHSKWLEGSRQDHLAVCWHPQ